MSTSGPGADLSFRQLVFSDMARQRTDAKPTWLHVLARCFTLPGLVASVIVRAQQCLFRSGYVRAASILRNVGVTVVGADVSPGAQFGPSLYLAHPVGLVIGAGARIGSDVTFAGGVTIGSRHPDGRGPVEYATIGDGTILSAHAVVLGGITIGQHVLVAANSVVLSDVPDFAIVGGAPARQIGTREGLA